MSREYKILISSGDFFPRTYRGIRTGENYIDKTISVSGDINENDLLAFASRVAITSYAERAEMQREGKVSGSMKENITNAFILDAHGLEDFVYGIPGDNFIKGITATIPFEKDKEPIIEVYSSEDIKRFDVIRSR